MVEVITEIQGGIWEFLNEKPVGTLMKYMCIGKLFTFSFILLYKRQNVFAHLELQIVPYCSNVLESLRPLFNYCQCLTCTCKTCMSMAKLFYTCSIMYHVCVKKFELLLHSIFMHNCVQAFTL